MIRRCCDCKKDMGEKEPFEDRRVTDGLCPKCLEKALNDNGGWSEKDEENPNGDQQHDSDDHCVQKWDYEIEEE